MIRLRRDNSILIVASERIDTLPTLKVGMHSPRHRDLGESDTLLSFPGW